MLFHSIGRVSAASLVFAQWGGVLADRVRYGRVPPSMTAPPHSIDFPRCGMIRFGAVAFRMSPRSNRNTSISLAQNRSIPCCSAVSGTSVTLAPRPPTCRTSRRSTQQLKERACCRQRAYRSRDGTDDGQRSSQGFNSLLRVGPSGTVLSTWVRTIGTGRHRRAPAPGPSPRAVPAGRVTARPRSRLRGPGPAG